VATVLAESGLGVLSLAGATKLRSSIVRWRPAGRLRRSTDELRQRRLCGAGPPPPLHGGVMVEGMANAVTSGWSVVSV